MTDDLEQPLDPELGPPAPADGPGRSGARRGSARPASRWRPSRSIAILFLFVFPTRSYLAQQRQVHAAHKAVEVLRAQNEQLAREAKKLQTPSEIERLARVQFNMVFAGEQAYNVISPAKPGATTTTPTLPAESPSAEFD